jgi:hypothetical protein
MLVGLLFAVPVCPTDTKCALKLAVAAGAVDDLAIMPLLRRGVKNIIACVATHTNPEGTMADFAEGEITGLQKCDLVPQHRCCTSLGVKLTPTCNGCLA